jgi:hypothetical protein
VTVQNYIGVPEICEVINTYHMDPEEGEIYFPNIEGEIFPPILAKTFEDPTELQFRLTYGGDSNYSNTEWLTLTIPDSPADPTIDHDND